ncbi:acyl-CoA N-acyltransferase [Exidia glandulosa HHB12029]|uniref:Acyl-CoA N-acyltransferase n=1 Tax=Exidia glandulosa HHB12029 TaxID=1314781 RepID=A0A165L719_EXIGL|nr:acyl-CoA N-acyltransferase [Exidia glandulosa HHB12029]
MTEVSSFVLETSRLYITPSDPTLEQHCSFYLKLMNSPSWQRWIGDSGLQTEEDARVYMTQRHTSHYRKHGFGYYVVSRKPDPSSLVEGAELVGSVSLLLRDGHTVPDIGFAFLDDAHGKGYATEAARALIDHAAKHWHIPRVIGLTTPANDGCKRALQKLGLHELGIRTLAAWPHHRIAIFAAEDVYDVSSCGVLLQNDAPSTFFA